MVKSLFLKRSKKRFNGLFLLFALLLSFVPIVSLPTNVQAATTLNVYPAPSGVTLNTTYTVKVRVPGGAWQDLDEYDTTLGHTTITHASFVNFDTDGPVDLSVTYNSGNITSAIIRPLNNNITPTISGNTMTFSISGPKKLSVEINGLFNTNLTVFANPLEVNPPSASDPNVIYLGPGVYNQDYTVPSGKTLYIAGGAVVKGGVILDNATNVKVLGRGILDHPSRKAISADYTNQVTIDGIIVNDYGDGGSGGCAISLGNSTNVTINNFKAFSFKKWTDGIDTFAASNISINDYFARTGDDGIAIYGSRSNDGRIWTGNSANISLTNSLLMPDYARPINIGTHGFDTAPGGGDTIDSVSFSNIDIVNLNATAPIQFADGDGNLITNVTFTDIRIDDNSGGRIVSIGTQKTDISVGRGINNVYFKNVTYTGNNTDASNINGYDATHLTQNITFENLVVNGNVILTPSAGNFSINSYTKNINFVASGTSVPTPTPLPAPTPINIALNKSASSDSSQSGHSASSGNDSSTTTRWCANDGNTGHWWMVDLGSNMDINGGTQVKWEKSGVAYKYKIETSSDNSNWTLKVDKTNNTDTNQTQTDLFLGTARYVRITVTGLASGAWASFYDFKVLGIPSNLAQGKTASADSTLSGYPASNASDGNALTGWSASDGNTGHWWKVDLGASRNIAYGTQVSWPTVGAATYQYKIETSMDNTNWTLQVDKTANTNTAQVQTDYFTATAQYVRITVTGLPSGANASFCDLKVFGDPINLAWNKSVSTDSTLSGYPASGGNDSSTSTRWSAGDASTGHWWTVDLGSSMSITGGSQVMWEKDGAIYKYKIETSIDNTNWNLQVDKTSTASWAQGNTRTAQVQSDWFTATAQYVRITVTGMTYGNYASFYDFKVFGTYNGATVFNDINYGSTAVTLAPGAYTLTQMQAAGVSDNWISSIQVPSGYTVIGYDGQSFDGTSWTFTANNANMVNSGNNDMISSIKVLSAGPTFYSNTNYGGTAVQLGAGTYTQAQLQAAGITNNSISSIRVPFGYTVVAYDGSSFDGTSWTFTSDNSNLVNTSNNDMISSIQITIN